FLCGKFSLYSSSIRYIAFLNSLERSLSTSNAVYGFDLEWVWVASTMIDFDFIIPFSRAIDTVLLINRFKRSMSFNRSLRNLVSELELITSSSGVISRKYLKDISYLERS